mmetsp:Transcript_5779/g.21858  ORF Transcript_5779/g.21858 Transcript_5779/m.21858 type:complete len:387 (-) Transcript_5779:1259-2419(-)
MCDNRMTSEYTDASCDALMLSWNRLTYKIPLTNPTYTRSILSTSVSPPTVLHSYASSWSVGSICSRVMNSSRSIRPSPSVSASTIHAARVFRASLVSSPSSAFMNTSSATSPASIVPFPSLSSMLNAWVTHFGYSTLDFSKASQSTKAARNSFTSMNPSLVVSSCASSCWHSSAVMTYPTRFNPASSSSGSTNASPLVSSKSNSSRNSVVSSNSFAKTPPTAIGDASAAETSRESRFPSMLPSLDPRTSSMESMESLPCRSWSPSRRNTDLLSNPYVLNRCKRATTCPPIGESCAAAVCCSHGCSSAARALTRCCGSRSIRRMTKSRQSGDSRPHGSLVKSAGSSRIARNTSFAFGRWLTLSTKGSRPVSNWYATTPHDHTSASAP